MNRNISLKNALILGFAFALLGAGGGLAVNYNQSAQAVGALEVPAMKKQADFQNFWQVWTIIQKRYPFEQPTDQEKVYSATAGLMASLDDPYSVFMPPQELEEFQQDIRGEFSGIGIEIDVINGWLTVISPLKDTPAFKSGLLPNDIISKIDGEDAQGMHINEAVDRIRGERGTEVLLEIAREGEGSMDVSVVRDSIIVPILETSQQGDAFIIELSSFSDQSSQLMQKAISEFRSSDADHIILDLRGNPGGLLDAAIHISSMFLPKGDVIVKERVGEDVVSEVHTSYGYDVLDPEVPMMTLIDGGSASASEILAGALQAHGRSDLMGSQSFGKGSVQELIPVGRDGAAVKLTIAQWLDPRDISISEEGLTPDHDLTDLLKERIVEIQSKRREALEVGEVFTPEKKDIILENALEYMEREY